MLTQKTLHLLGYASGIAGSHSGSANGPIVLQQSPYFLALKEKGIDLHWQAMIKTLQQNNLSKLALVTEQCKQLAEKTAALAKEKNFFMVLGGDHTSAIGTWSGVASTQKNIGLIWIDAHMDSHTPKTSLTGNLHGMPLACLLGHGENSLTKLMNDAPKLHPQHLCLIGVRSFEPGEEKLLKQLNVRIFYMEEIKQRGLSAVFADAIKIVSQGTCGFGMSIDIDSIDPLEAPGTGVPEPDGISAHDLLSVLTTVKNNSNLMGVEIVEFDPQRDKNQLTEKLIPKLIAAIMLGIDT